MHGMRIIEIIIGIILIGMVFAMGIVLTIPIGG